MSSHKLFLLFRQAKKYFRTYFVICFYATIVVVGILLLFGQVVSGQGKWGVYHYYINSKYIHELGYFDLYSCSVEAKPELFAQGSNVRVRDLHTYELVATKDLRPCSVDHFGTLRFEEFEKDLDVIADGPSKNYWSSVVKDKGFNPPPFWLTVSSAVHLFFDLGNSTLRFVLFHLDVLFFAGALVVIWKGSSIRHTGVTLFLILLYPGTFGELTNTYLQYMWFPLLAISFFFERKKQFVLSGVMLGVASALQIFPAVFAIPFFSFALISFFRNRRKEFLASLQFLVSFVMVFALCFFVSYLHLGSSLIFFEWYEKILIHSDYIKGEIFNIGFSNLIGTVFSPTAVDTYGYLSEYMQTVLRNKTIGVFSPLIVLFSLLSVFCVVKLQSKRVLQSQFVYGYFLVYVFLTLSPYYYVSLTLLPFILLDEKVRLVRVVMLGLFALFVFGFGEISFRYVPNLFREMGIFTFFVLFYIVIAKQSSLFFFKK